MTILLGGIDLSIPAVIGLANVLTVRWYGNGLPFPLVVLCVMAIAMAIGAVNGVLSRALGAHPLLITLAASFMILGGVLVYTEGRTIGTAPDYLLQAVSPAGRTGPIPLPPIVIIWFLLSALVVAVEQLSVPGRLLFATGASERAARLSLAPVTVIWAAAFAASASACAAIAGICSPDSAAAQMRASVSLISFRRSRRSSWAEQPCSAGQAATRALSQAFSSSPRPRRS